MNCGYIAIFVLWIIASCIAAAIYYEEIDKPLPEKEDVNFRLVFWATLLFPGVIGWLIILGIYKFFTANFWSWNMFGIKPPAAPVYNRYNDPFWTMEEEGYQSVTPPEITPEIVEPPQPIAPPGRLIKEGEETKSSNDILI